MKWYYAENGCQIGPLSEEEFRDLIRTRKITPATLVWNPSMAGWAPFRTVADDGAAMVEVAPRAESGPDARSPAGENFPAAAAAAETEAAAAPAPPSPEQESGPMPKPSPTPAGEQILARTVAYAGFWQRGVAKVIDLFLLGAAGILLAWLIALAVPSLGGFPAVVTSPAGWGLGLVLAACHTTFFLGRFNATPGKMLLGLSVMTATGDDIGYWRAFLRFGGEVFSGLLLGWGFFRAAIDPETCTLHDHLVHSRVVSE